MNYGENVPVPEIRQVHLSLIRTFCFCQKNSKFRNEFGFLGDNSRYFEMVLEDNERLAKKKIGVPGLGKLRSVLGRPESENVVNADGFFHTLQKFYLELWGKSGGKLGLTPHYPCALDILPSTDREYEIVASTLPESLQEADSALMSSSMRIYPAGIASLRLGFFFSTERKFEVRDIISFLWNKRTVIKVDNEELSIDSFSRKCADKAIAGFIGESPPRPDWRDTYSAIDIVDASGLVPFEQGYNEIFLPLLNLDENPEEEEGGVDNLSNRGDVLLPGRKSVVSYLPSARSDCDRRKVRRWLRSLIELFSIQKFLAGSIEAATVYEKFRLNKQNWMGELKRGILPYDIRPLFSLALYTQLHRNSGMIEKKAWRIRYQKMLEKLDQNEEIQEANSKAVAELEKIKSETGRSEEKAGKWVSQLVEILAKFKPT